VYKIKNSSVLKKELCSNFHQHNFHVMNFSILTLFDGKHMHVFRNMKKKITTVDINNCIVVS